MPEGEHAAIFETYDGEVRQVRVTGTLDDIRAVARAWGMLDGRFCIRWADSNTCACAHYRVS